jgi:HSP20 family protein
MYWPTLRPFGRKSDVAASANDPFTAFRREMDQLFESFGRDLGWPGGDDRTAAAAPSVDVSETDSELRIEADLPGVEEKDVDVVIADDLLTIKGEKRRRRRRGRRTTT